MHGWVELTSALNHSELRRRCEIIPSECEFLMLWLSKIGTPFEMAEPFLYLINSCFIGHGISCPVRRATWYTLGDTPRTWGDSLECAMSYAVVNYTDYEMHHGRSCLIYAMVCTVPTGERFQPTKVVQDRGGACRAYRHSDFPAHMTVGKSGHAPWFVP